MSYTGEKKRQYEREYYAKNKKKINERKCKPVYCEFCNCSFKGIVNKAHHNRTKKHLNNLSIE